MPQAVLQLQWKQSVITKMVIIFVIDLLFIDIDDSTKVIHRSTVVYICPAKGKERKVVYICGVFRNKYMFYHRAKLQESYVYFKQLL